MRRAILGLWLCLCVPQGGAAQIAPWNPSEGLPVGSEEEGYLRALQVIGRVPAYPWSIRGFLPFELRRVLPTDATHPWASPETPPTTLGWTGLETRAWFNSSVPIGESDGPAWVGKGATVSVSGGGYARWGRVHARFSPEFFFAQNADYTLTPNGLAGSGVFRDPINPRFIDLPQRFGQGSYTRVDLGTSWLIADLGALAVGVSSAAQTWGPSIEFPLLLGNNAGGFAHAFIQSARPISVGFGSIHARLIVGRLDESEYSPADSSASQRVASAAAVVFVPRGVPGLELGVHRFVEAIWDDRAISLQSVLRPFSTVANPADLKVNPAGENQLGGVFARWVVPAAAIEVYFEIIRDDFARDLRHYILDPDDLSARTFGLQRAITKTASRITMIRAEVVSAETSHSERGDRPGSVLIGPISRYRHTSVVQGHTQRGQLLGSPAAYGGSGWTVGVDRYGPSGRWSIETFRRLMQDRVEDPGISGVAEVLYGVRVEVLRRFQRHTISGTLAPTWVLNRNTVRGATSFNVNLGFALRGLTPSR